MAQLLRGLWSFILGCLRVIFIGVCLIYTLVQVIGFWAYLRQDMVKEQKHLPGLGQDNTDRIQFFITLISAMIGAHGAIFANQTSLKVFAYITALNVAAHLVRIHHSSKSMGDETDEFFKTMVELEPDYDWTDKGGHSLANRAWDNLQSIKCCGSTGPADWDLYRPNSVVKAAYPASCCPPPSDPCLADYKTGCMKQLDYAQRSLLKFKLGYVIAQIGLFLIACMLVSCQPTNNQRRVRLNPSQVYANVQANNRTVRPTYMRQPAYNEQMIPLDGSRKPNLPPLYPELNMADRYQPPPSYGSGY